VTAAVDCDHYTVIFVGVVQASVAAVRRRLLQNTSDVIIVLPKI